MRTRAPIEDVKMIEVNVKRLRAIGCTQPVAQALAGLDEEQGTPMRVTEVHRETVRLSDGGGELSARLLPRLQRALADADALAVGDWVLGFTDEHGDAWVGARMPPLTQIVRRDSSGARQVLVSNVDTAMLLMGCDGDFNPRRIERYLAMVKPAGIWPVIVLTKADLAGDAEARRETLSERLPRDVAIHCVDARATAAAIELAPYLGAGQTIVMLGSSGAGKSTLTNSLLGAHVQDTGAVREDDSRGRHTTTTRSLHRLPGGACVIDTPGLRGLRPDIGEEDLAAAFSDIQALAEQCRFRDCSHGDEPGCAVRANVAADRLVNYQKMLREIRRETMTPLQRREQLAMWKARGKAAELRMKMKRG
jgi:ribosome biogenesis GTPase / thiamine phosphate phosphatase